MAGPNSQSRFLPLLLTLCGQDSGSMVPPQYASSPSRAAQQQAAQEKVAEDKNKKTIKKEK